MVEGVQWLCRRAAIPASGRWQDRKSRSGRRPVARVVHRLRASRRAAVAVAVIIEHRRLWLGHRRPAAQRSCVPPWTSFAATRWPHAAATPRFRGQSRASLFFCTWDWSPGARPSYNPLMSPTSSSAGIISGATIITEISHFARNQATPTCRTSAINQGTLQLTVGRDRSDQQPEQLAPQVQELWQAHRGPGTVGQPVAAGQVLARQDTTDLGLPQSGPGELAQQQANGHRLGRRDRRSRQRSPRRRSTPLERHSRTPRRASPPASPASTRPSLRHRPTSARPGNARAAEDVAQHAGAGTATLEADQAALRTLGRCTRTSWGHFTPTGRVQAQLAQQQLAVQNAQKTLDDARASLAATEAALDGAARTDAVSVQNAQQALE